MNGLISKVRRFLTSDDGPTAVEYAVMLALIIVACVTVVSQPGHQHQRNIQFGEQFAQRIVMSGSPRHLPHAVNPSVSAFETVSSIPPLKFFHEGETSPDPARSSRLRRHSGSGRA